MVLQYLYAFQFYLIEFSDTASNGGSNLPGTWHTTAVSVYLRRQGFRDSFLLDLSEIICANGTSLPPQGKPVCVWKQTKWEISCLGYSHNKAADFRRTSRALQCVLVRVEKCCVCAPVVPLGVCCFQFKTQGKWLGNNSAWTSKWMLCKVKLIFIILPDLSTNQRSVLCPIHVWIKWYLKKLQRSWKKDRKH